MGVTVGVGVTVITVVIMAAAVVVAPAAMMVLVIVGIIDRVCLAADGELRCSNASPTHAVDPNGSGRNRQTAERAPDLVERNARVNQRSDDHVAGRPREAVEIERRQTRSSYSARPGIISDSTIEKYC